MEIYATGRLKYKEPEYGANKLILVVKFKENGKLFNTKIKKTLVSSYYWDKEKDDYVYEEGFYDLLLKWTSDVELLSKWVESEVLNYFEGKKEQLSDKEKFKQFEKQLKSMSEIKVTVKLQ